MNSTDTPPAELTTFEIVPKDVILPPEEKQSLIESFSPLLAKARELLEESKGITSAKLARVCRLSFRKLRGDSEDLRKSRKDHHLRMGRAIDGAHAILVAAVKGEEERMETIERAEERRLAAEIADRDAHRRELLAPYQLQSVGVMNYGAMSEPDFQTLLDDAKGLHEARIKREEEEAAAKLAKEVAEAKERERIRLDNERLLREAQEREETARVERERAAREKAEMEAKLAQERAQAAKKAAEAQAKADAAAKAAEEKARKEREAIEAKAKAEREEADRIAATERAALEAKLAEEESRLKAAKDEAERLNAEFQKAKEAKDKELADEAAAAEQAALAPDREKMKALAQAIRCVAVPVATTKKGQAAIEQIKTKLAEMAQWVEKKAQTL